MSETGPPPDRWPVGSGPSAPDRIDNLPGTAYAEAMANAANRLAAVPILTTGTSRMKQALNFAAKYWRFFWAISLFLLQTDYSGARSVDLASSGSSSSATTPIPSPVANPRFSPFPGNWVNVTSNLAGMTSECGNMTFVSAKPNEDLVIAGIALRGLWGSTDGGISWHQLSRGDSATIINRPGSIIYDPVRPNVFWESGIYNSNGVYRTDNDGSVFQALGSIRHNDTVSVDFTDLNRQTLLAGGHEQKQTLYRSQDGGNTWRNVGVNLPAGTAFSSYPLVINSKTFFAGCSPSWGGGTGGIYQSNDSGATWNSASVQGGGAQPLIASDGSIYWPSGDGAMVRGTGQGSNWIWNQTVASGTLMNVHPIELPDGRIVSLSSQHIMISSDHGLNWQPFGPQLPFAPVGVSYSDFDKSFYIWQFDCGNKVLPNAIMKIWL
jgi:hypothetical protein